MWNKEELAQQWMDSIIVSIYRKDDKTDKLKSNITVTNYTENFI
jgi:hypothetical protein